MNKEEEPMDDNTKEVKTTRAIAACIVVPLVVITAAFLIGDLDGHRADVEIARHQADRAREEAAKAMWDHMQCSPQPQSPQPNKEKP